MNLQSNKVRIGAGVALGAVVAAVFFSPIRDWVTMENVSNLARYLGALGEIWYVPLVFILVFAVSCVLFLPASVFIVTAGVIWGAWPGTLYAIVGAVIGAHITYHVARFIGGGVIARFGSQGERLAAALEGADFKALLILRLIPLFPFPVFNYAAGVSRVRSQDFVLSTAAGLLPATLVITYSSYALVAGVLSKEELLKRVFIVCGAVLVLVLLPLVFKKRAQEALHLEPEADEMDSQG